MPHSHALLSEALLIFKASNVLNDTIGKHDTEALIFVGKCGSVAEYCVHVWQETVTRDWIDV